MNNDEFIFPGAAPGRFHHIVPLVVLAVTLSLLAQWLAGDLGLPLMEIERLLYIAAFVAISGIFYPVACLLPAVIDRIVQGRTTEDMAPPWKTKNWSPVMGVTIILFTLYGITATGNLTELYRAGTTVWYDEALWQLEYPLFSALRGSWLDQPHLWDAVYFQMWIFVLMAAAYIHSADGIRSYAVFGLALLLSFYLTRYVNLLFPTAGPAFFQPDWFSLAGTTSQATQDILRDFMAGRIPPNGIYPATMAMPSLHVGLTGIAAWFLARRRPWTLWLSLPWLLLVWLSTVILGWHYVLDGPAGLIVAGIATLLAGKVQNVWDSVTLVRPSLTPPASAESEPPLQPEGD